MKTLSVIVPSYNMERYLPKCLGSLVVSPESMECLEVLVVNDGSTDSTSEIAHDFERRYPGVFRVIDKANGHYGSCVNVALKVATGTYVKVLDADDSFDTLHFTEYLRFLTTVDVDVIMNAYRTVAPDGAVLYHNRFELPPLEEFDIGVIEHCADRVYMHGLAYRRDLLQKMEYRQKEGCPYTDAEWVALPLLLAERGTYFDKEVYVYLNGREGQSIGAAAQRKSFRVLADVLHDIVEQKGKLRVEIPAANERFFAAWVVGYARLVVGIAIGVLPSFGFGRAFHYWDTAFKRACSTRCTSVYDGYVLSNSIRFKYLDFISRHCWTGDWVMLFVRLFQRMLRSTIVQKMIRGGVTDAKCM